MDVRSEETSFTADENFFTLIARQSALRVGQPVLVQNGTPRKWCPFLEQRVLDQGFLRKLRFDEYDNMSVSANRCLPDDARNVRRVFLVAARRRDVRTNKPNPPQRHGMNKVLKIQSTLRIRRASARICGLATLNTCVTEHFLVDWCGAFSRLLHLLHLLHFARQTSSGFSLGFLWGHLTEEI